MNEKKLRFLTRQTPGMQVVDKVEYPEYWLWEHVSDDRLAAKGWQLTLGTQLNLLLKTAKGLERDQQLTPGLSENERLDACRFISALRAVVERVADFEELIEEPEETDVQD
jgi:hypothetical protein